MGQPMKVSLRLAGGLFFLLFWLSACGDRGDRGADCVPTPADELGPFYRPGAPIRDKVGSGYRLKGRVLSGRDCRPLAGARVEYWLVNPQGEYDDDHRATLYSDRHGYYHCETNRPTDYVGRLPHIHLLVNAAGHHQLITQHYPAQGQTVAQFDLVLEPRN